MYSHRSTLGPVDLVFTDRIDGLEDAVADFAPAGGVVELDQVHGTHVEVLTAGYAVSDAAAPPAADASVTDRADVTLMVRAADCVPVLLADPDAGVIGAAHAGRRGMAEGIVGATVASMRDLGACRITAWVGPHICGACYEVPGQLQEEVAARVPAARSTTSWGTPALDIGAGVRAQLVEAGVHVIDAGGCTMESPSLHSFRRDGAAAGRHAGLIRRRSAEPGVEQ